jgi:hypothetical protein
MTDQDEQDRATANPVEGSDPTAAFGVNAHRDARYSAATDKSHPGETVLSASASASLWTAAPLSRLPPESVA